MEPRPFLIRHGFRCVICPGGNILRGYGPLRPGYPDGPERLPCLTSSTCLRTTTSRKISRVVPDQTLQILDSQVQRQLDYEYVVDGEPNPETEFRHYDLDEEFQERDVR